MFSTILKRSLLLLAFIVLARQSAGITTTELISANNLGTGSSDGNSAVPSVSADERFVAFVSNGNDLTPFASGGNIQCYVRDVVDGTTSMVSINASGTAAGNSDCVLPLISANGRYVVFYTRATNLVATDTNGFEDVFVRDLILGTTKLVSVNLAGTDSANGPSISTSISADGRYVAFQSDAANLSAIDNNVFTDVYVRDMVAGATLVGSINAAGTATGNGLSQNPVISADGSSVAFESGADNLVTSDTNGMFDVFVRNFNTATTALVSKNIAGTDSGNGPATAPSINADGRYVAFQSQASNLVAADTNGVRDVFVRDVVSGITSLVSANASGTDSGNNTSSAAVISDNGAVVVFQSAASNLVATDTNGAIDVFAWHKNGIPTQLLSANNAGTNSGNGLSNVPSVSPNGSFAGFQSVASNLATTDGNSVSDVFTRWIAPGNTYMASINDVGTDSGNGDSPSVSASRVTDDGSIAFDSSASNLVANDINVLYDVFLRTSYQLLNDFEDNNVASWTVTGNGTLTASSGIMHAVTAKKFEAFAPYNGFMSSILTDVTFLNAGAKVSLNAWYLDKNNRIELQILPDKNKCTLKVHSSGHILGKKSAKNIALSLNQKHIVSLVFAGFTPQAVFQVFVDGTKIIDLTSGLTSLPGTGQVGLELGSKTHANVSSDFGGLMIHFVD